MIAHIAVSSSLDAHRVYLLGWWEQVPRVKHRLGDTAVNRLRWSLEGRRLAVGDTSGTLSLFEVSSRVRLLVVSWSHRCVCA